MKNLSIYKTMSSSERDQLIKALMVLNERTSKISDLVAEFKELAKGKGVEWSEVVSHLTAAPPTTTPTASTKKKPRQKLVPLEPNTTYVNPEKPGEYWTSKAIVRRVPTWLKDLAERTGEPYLTFKKT